MTVEVEGTLGVILSSGELALPRRGFLGNLGCGPTAEVVRDALEGGEMPDLRAFADMLPQRLAELVPAVLLFAAGRPGQLPDAELLPAIRVAHFLGLEAVVYELLHRLAARWNKHGSPIMEAFTLEMLCVEPLAAWPTTLVGASCLASAAFHEEAPGVRQAARSWISDSGMPGVRALARVAVEDHRGKVRRAAARALRRLHLTVEVAVPELMRVMREDQERRHRLRATATLAELGVRGLAALEQDLWSLLLLYLQRAVNSWSSIVFPADFTWFTLSIVPTCASLFLPMMPCAFVVHPLIFV